MGPQNPVNSPVEGMVVEIPIIYKVLAPSQAVVWDFGTINGISTTVVQDSFQLYH